MTLKHFTKRHMTLIELMIVIGLLSLVMGVIGLGIGTAVSTERFRASTGMLVDKLRLAQDIMLILRSSVRMELQQQDSGLLVTLHTEEGLTPALVTATSQPVLITGIHQLQFIDSDGKITSGKVILDFLSGGSRMSRGKLVVSSGSDSEDIYLTGYPRPIKAGQLSASDALSDSDSAIATDLYPRQVIEEERRRNDQNAQAAHPTT